MAVASASDEKNLVVTFNRGIRGDAGTDGADGLGFEQVRGSKLKSPIVRVLAPNYPAVVGFDSLTWDRLTSATGLNKYAQLATALDGIPRETIDGWQIEGAGENKLDESIINSANGWSIVNATETSATVLAPDGTNTAAEMVGTGIGAFGYIKSITLSELNATATFSAYYSRGTTGKQARFLISNETGAVIYGVSTIRLDTLATTASALAGASNASTTYQLIGEDWVRLEFTLTLPADNSIRLYVYTEDSGTTAYHVFGAQVEEHPFATSYIEANVDGNTRDADAISMPAFNNVPNLDDAFSVFFRLYVDGFTGGEDFVFSFSNGVDTDNKTVCCFVQDGVLTFRLSDGVTDVDATIAINIETPYTICIRKNLNSIVLSVDGVVVQTVAHSLTIPTGVAGLLKLGGNEAGVDKNLYGKLYDFRVYDFYLNDDEATFLSEV